MDKPNKDNQVTKQIKERAERLRYLRLQVLRLSRAEMEQKLGIATASLENWEYGRYSGLTERGAKRIQSALEKLQIHCPEEWLLYGLGSKPTSSLLEQFNRLSGQPIADDSANITEELNTFHRLNPHSIHLQIADDSMLPCYQPHDYVAGVQYFGKNIEKALNKVCIITTLDGNTLIRLVKAGVENKYSLACSNPHDDIPAMLSNVTLSSAAPVLWVRRKSQN